MTLATAKFIQQVKYVKAGRCNKFSVGHRKIYVKYGLVGHRWMYATQVGHSKIYQLATIKE
jgi:hypothetical protein